MNPDLLQMDAQRCSGADRGCWEIVVRGSWTLISGEDDALWMKRGKAGSPLLRMRGRRIPAGRGMLGRKFRL